MDFANPLTHDMLVAQLMLGGLTSEVSLILMSEAGAVHLSIDCRADDASLAGRATMPDGSARPVFARMSTETALCGAASTCHTWELATDSVTRETLDAATTTRVANLCAAMKPAEQWEDCLSAEMGPKGKPRHDMACATERHRRLYGQAFLPNEKLPGAPRLGHLRPFGEQGQKRIPAQEVSGCPSAHDFYVDHLAQLRPLVMRGCALETMGDVMERWTDDYLRELAPEHKTSSDACNEPLATFLARYRQPGSNWGHGSYRRCSELPEEMLQELPLHPFLEGAEARGIDFRNALTWMHSGASDQMSRLHYDMNGVILTQLSGRKSLLMVSPEDSLGLYTDHMDDPYVNTSPIDEKKVDLDKHPRVAQLTLQAVSTSPGDIIFIPTRTWHIVWDPSAGDAPPERNLAYTLEVSWRHEPWDLPSYVHAPAFSHDLLRWAHAYRRGATGREVAGTERAAGRATFSSTRFLNSLGIKSSGFCSAMKASNGSAPFSTTAADGAPAAASATVSSARRSPSAGDAWCVDDPVSLQQQLPQVARSLASAAQEQGIDICAAAIAHCDSGAKAACRATCGCGDARLLTARAGAGGGQPQVVELRFDCGARAAASVAGAVYDVDGVREAALRTSRDGSGWDLAGMRLPPSTEERMAALCAKKERFPSDTPREEWDPCGTQSHFFDYKKKDSDSAPADGGRNESCILSRHLRAWGPHFLPPSAACVPGAPCEPPQPTTPDAGASPAVGHLLPFGQQGQTSSPIPEHAGCLNASAFHAVELAMRPLILRQCASASMPEALAWTDDHFRRVAPEHMSPNCPVPLADYLKDYQKADGAYPARPPPPQTPSPLPEQIPPLPPSPPSSMHHLHSGAPWHAADLQVAYATGYVVT